MLNPIIDINNLVFNKKVATVVYGRVFYYGIGCGHAFEDPERPYGVTIVIKRPENWLGRDNGEGIFSQFVLRKGPDNLDHRERFYFSAGKFLAELGTRENSDDEIRLFIPYGLNDGQKEEDVNG